MSSIQRRLGLGLTAILIVVGMAFAQLSLWIFDTGLRRYMQIQLEDESQNVLSALLSSSEGLQLAADRIPPSFKMPFSGNYYVVAFDDVVLRSRSLWDHNLDVPAAHGLQKALILGPQQQQLLVHKAQYRRFSKTITVVAAIDYTPIIKGFSHARWAGLALGLFTLLLVLALQRFIVKRALQPLDTIKLQIEQLQGGQRTALDQDVVKELQPLVAQVNHLLKSTEAMIQRSRNTAGNLGHALKTPLAVLYSLLQQSAFQQDAELKKNVQQQLNLIEQKMARELSKARLVGDALPGAYFVCANELPTLLSLLKQVHGRELIIEWHDQQQLSLPWNREDVLELLGNLLDNACKWARQRVVVSVRKTPAHYEIVVEDDGPGINEQDYDRMLERGTRLDEHSVAGHGLGLAIVNDIVNHFAGDLAFSRSELGGLAVQVLLPIKH